MALTTRPVVSSACTACKRHVEKSSVVVEEKCLTACVYHEECLRILMDIFEKGNTLPPDVFCNKVKKIAEFITGEKESRKIFRTFCALSFVDRYQGKPMIAETMKRLDNKINHRHFTMFSLLEEECFQLLTRMGTIENLSSLDTDLICLLCTLCKQQPEDTSLNNLLLEIGRSVWPYINRPLWGSEHFVDFISDILKVVGVQLEKLHPRNFSLAWKVILSNVVGLRETLSSCSRLRLLSIVECKQNRWELPESLVEYYRQEYKEFLEAKKKVLFSCLGYFPSRRKTSLTVKPGRSAADFLKRRLSSEQHGKVEHSSSSSSCDSSDFFNEAFEEVFEVEETQESSSLNITKSNDGVKAGNSILSNDSEETVDIKRENSTLPEQTEQFVHRTDILNLNQGIFDKNAIKNFQNDGCQTMVAMSLDVNNIESPTDNKLDHEPLNEDVVSGESGTDEGDWFESSSQGASGISSETSFSNVEHKSLFLERKKEIMKVPRKYVGRVIGTRGSVIISIQDETGVKVNYIKNKGEKGEETEAASEEEENKTTEQQEVKLENEEEEFEIIGTNETISKAKRKIESIINHMKWLENRAFMRSLSEGATTMGEATATEGNVLDDGTSSEASSTDNERRSLFAERKTVIVKVPRPYVGRVIGSRGTMIMSIEEESGAKVTFVKDQDEEANSNSENKSDGGEPQEAVAEKEEYDFELFGTDETIRKAKRKIDSIIRYAMNSENRATLTRSMSEAGPRPSFKQIYRSLSCPIPDWGESCAGDCASCQKGCYCRTFLLSKLESPTSWIRPEDLSITRHDDWTTLIVKTQVENVFRRPSRDSVRSSTDDDSNLEPVSP